MKSHASIIDVIGNTPMAELHHIAKVLALSGRILAKCEYPESRPSVPIGLQSVSQNRTKMNRSRIYSFDIDP